MAALGQWSQRAAEVVDLIVRVWVLKELREARRPEDLEPVVEGLSRLVDPMAEAALNGLDRAYAHEWRAFARLVDDCLDGLEADAGVHIRQREHVNAVLDWLQGNGATAEESAVPQKELAAGLGLSKATASYVLGLMETAGLVARVIRGREKDVYALASSEGPALHHVSGRGQTPEMKQDKRNTFADYLGQAG